MSDTPKRCDVRQILEAFTHEELAVFMVRTLHAESPGDEVSYSSMLFDVDSTYYPELVATVRTIAGKSRGVKVRERDRDTGYYVVYNSNLVIQAVAYWNDEVGGWFSSHLDTADSLGGSSLTVVQPLGRMEASDG